MINNYLLKNKRRYFILMLCLLFNGCGNSPTDGGEGGETTGGEDAEGLSGTWIGALEIEEDDLIIGDILKFDYTLVLATTTYIFTIEMGIPGYPQYSNMCIYSGDYTTTDTDISLLGNHTQCDNEEEGYENQFDPYSHYGEYVLSDDILTITFTDNEQNEDDFQDEEVEQYTIIFYRQ